MTDEFDLELQSMPEEAIETETFDFSSPEDVLIEVVDGFDESVHSMGDPPKGWNRWRIEYCTIINKKNPDVTGAASYENIYGGFLDYTVEGLVDCPEKEGWFVVVGVTADYSRDDGWMTDDNMDFYYEGFRPATLEEIALA